MADSIPDKEVNPPLARKPVPTAAAPAEQQTGSDPSKVDAELHNAAEPPAAKLEDSTSTLRSNQEQSNVKPSNPRISTSAKPSIDVDKTQPEDFEGHVQTTNELPTPETIKKIENYIVLDKDGKSHTFKSLYCRPNVARRVMIIFVRHFFCGNCQDFIRSLSESITPDSLLRLPVSTFIAIVGCGDPGLIDMYAKETKCQFPIYTDPKRSLFDALDMNKTLVLGTKPAYTKRPMAQSIVESIAQGLRYLPSGLSLKSGNHRQVGGEFLFEPIDLVTPINTPPDERWKTLAPPPGGDARLDDDGESEEKRVTWCHRMRTTRDHAEIPELMEVLGLDGQGFPIKDQKRWAEALRTRKGTGESMARKMSELTENQGVEPA